MALTAGSLAAAMRLTDGEAPAEPLLSIVNRLLAVGNAFVDKFAPAAPSAIRDEAVVRLAAYLYDQPHYGRAMAMASAWRSSGAAGVVGPWVPIVGVNVDADDLDDDGTFEARLLPYLFRLPADAEKAKLRAAGRLDA